MADEETKRPVAELEEKEDEAEEEGEGPETPEQPAEKGGVQATPKKQEAKKRSASLPKERAKAAAGKAKEGEKAGKIPKAPRRPTLPPELKRLLAIRQELKRHRPLFVREQAHRYYAVGRFGNWRRPRGLQSKQRRHYGYRSVVVRIGYGSPAATRGLTPSGFRPRLIRTGAELATLDAKLEAAIIARTVGTRRRLVLEEAARKKGIHVLNPILKEREEE